MGSEVWRVSQTPTDRVTCGRSAGGAGHRDPSALHGLHRRLAGGLGEDPGELVAADPGQHVLGAGGGPQALGDADEHLVPGLVAAGVIDELEVVHVDHRH